MRHKTNMRVRAVMFEYDMPQWVLADLLDISEQSLSRAFRYERTVRYTQAKREHTQTGYYNKSNTWRQERP